MSTDVSRDGSSQEHPIVERMLDDVATLQPAVVEDLDADDIRQIEPERLTGSVVATIGTLAVAAFVAMLMETALGVALPAVMADLRIRVDVAQWLTTGFLLTMAVVIPTTGFLMQRLRTRTLFTGGMAVFALGTLAAALAPNFTLLLAGRVLQAAGTAVIMPQLMAITLASVPLRFRGTVMGFNTVVIMGAPALGPTLSGLVIDTLGWRWLFWFVLPVVVVVLLAGVFVLRTDGETRAVPLDVPSVLLAAVGFGGLIYAMASMRPILEGARAPVVLGLLGLLAVVVFVRRQLRLSRRGAPLLDLTTFRVPNFRVGIVMAGALFVTLFGAMIVLPIHLQLGLGFTALVTGLALLPGPVLQGLLAPLIGRLSDAVGPRPLVIPGTILLTAAVFSMTSLRAGVPLALVVGISIAMSLGM
ncbi:MAG: multidrug efflux MFS transporter, partial [Propionibacterium sp.]|nr:multidrug efflux MFS transporter [Propionibacterium sp.]